MEISLSCLSSAWLDGDTSRVGFGTYGVKVCIVVVYIIKRVLYILVSMVFSSIRS